MVNYIYSIKYVLTFIIFVGCLIYIYQQSNKQYVDIETFEDDISNPNDTEEGKSIYKDKTLENCLQFCKETKNCYGSIYNEKTGKCLLSRSLINKENQLNDDNLVCIKPYNIYSSHDNYPSLVERRRNSVFVCSKKAEDFPKYYFHNDGKLYHTYEKIMLDGIHNVDNYTVKNYLY